MRTQALRPGRWSRAFACVGSVVTVLSALTGTAAARTGHAVAPVGVLRWSPPQRIDPGAGFAAVSCPSAGFCMVVDELGDAMSWHGNHWSAPLVVDPHQGPLHALSCPTAHSCAAVDQFGRVLWWNGRSWSKPVLLDSQGLQDISCPSTRFCAAADFAGRALTWNGARWSAPVTLEPGGQGFSTLTCPSPRACAAMTTDGFFASWDGKRWSKPVDENSGGASVSALFDCLSATFCVISFSNGDVLVERGRGSPRPVLVDRSGTGFSALSCPTKSFCMGVDRHGSSFSWNGTSWSGPLEADPSPGPLGLTSVSCPTSTLCVAVDANGAALVARP